jgi:hypothetical protein
MYKTIFPEPQLGLGLVAFDTETHLIAPGNVIPDLVCVTACEQGAPGEPTSEIIVSTGDPQDLLEYVHAIFDDPSVIKVAHNAKFDLAVLCKYDPTLIPKVFREIEHGRVSDTILRGKLLNLTTHGEIDFEPGHGRKASYSLAALVNKYFDEDISGSKSGDSWRLRYSELDGLSVSEWPREAISYAMGDAVYVAGIYWKQEEARQKVMAERKTLSGEPVDPFQVETFRTAADFALHLMGARGIRIDPEAKQEVEMFLAGELTPEKLNLLIKEKILIPPQPPRPYARGATDKDGNVKMTKPKPEKISQTRLKAYVEALAARDDRVKLMFTDPSDKYPEGQLSVGADFLEDYAHLDPVLTQYQHRQKLQKLVTTELPRMEWEGETADLVHPVYDCLKRTGRSSSYSTDLYPSANVQNVDPRIRRCYVPREGYLFFSVDYSQMELGTLAQTLLNLFGHSVLADKINAGVDVHAYLGSQLAHNLDADFREECREQECHTPDYIFDLFAEKDEGDEAARRFYKHYRTFAKPTGLGYPGGLGPATFVKYAKGTYGIEVDEEMAAELRDIWKATYPEMEEYFEEINSRCEDPWNQDLYHYTTPMGMHRAGCFYCACANGLGLQSPSAEGALSAVYRVMRAATDPSQGSILADGVYPMMFVHDEIIGEVRDDEYAEAKVREVARIMIESMRVITPDVRVGADPVLMRRWYKKAEPVYDENGWLIPWEPED